MEEILDGASVVYLPCSPVLKRKAPIYEIQAKKASPALYTSDSAIYKFKEADMMQLLKKSL